MKNIKCNDVEGAMYAFPRIFLGKKAIEEAKKRNMEPDLFYVLQCLEKTGSLRLIIERFGVCSRFGL